MVADGEVANKNNTAKLSQNGSLETVLQVNKLDKISKEEIQRIMKNVEDAIIYIEERRFL